MLLLLDPSSTSSDEPLSLMSAHSFEHLWHHKTSGAYRPPPWGRRYRGRGSPGQTQVHTEPCGGSPSSTSCTARSHQVTIFSWPPSGHAHHQGRSSGGPEGRRGMCQRTPEERRMRPQVFLGSIIPFLINLYSNWYLRKLISSTTKQSLLLFLSN